ncbi:DUF3888 domain-containing protein [Sutcliffiella halmapala]
MKHHLFILIFAAHIIFHTASVSAMPTMPPPPEQSREELYHDMYLTLLSKDIDSAVSDYYADYLTISPMVYGYMIDVTRAERVGGYRSFGFSVTLEATPVVGPHLSVGKDRMVFQIDRSGAKLLNYEHLESHELPRNWKHIVKPRGISLIFQ